MAGLSVLLLGCVLALAFFSSSTAAVPKILTLQGRLEQAGSLASGAHDMNFYVYDAATSGNLLWSEVHNGVNQVTVTNGFFAVNLGEITALDLDFSQQYWLGIKIGANDEMSPRIKLTAAPYAALFVDVSENEVGIGTVSPGSTLDVNGTINVSTTFSATGGTITYSGGYTIHTFTSSGTFTPTGSGNVEVLVVAGGGGGGKGEYNPGGDGAGGGGAGGLSYNSSYAVTAQAYAVTVGGGGAGSTAISAKGANGSNSVFSSLTAVGGGGGGSDNHDAAGINKGAEGGSGGGAASKHDEATSGGAGTTNQGNNGGSSPLGIRGGGGGGGAGAVGATAPGAGGAGGVGLTYLISGASVYYAGGGGGGPTGTGAGGAGGLGGGGAGGTGGGAGASATPNTGGGGGGGAGQDNSGNGGAGGSGIVIVRYPTPGTSNVVVNSSGNVGIGTTSPAAKLDIEGDVRINGTLDVVDSSQVYFRGTVAQTVGGTNYVATLTQSSQVGGWTLTANNTQLVVPKSGLYMIYAQQLLQSSNTHYYYLRVNGATQVHGYKPSAATWHKDMVVSTLKYLNAGDYIDIYISGTVTNQTWGESHSQFYAVRIQ